MAKEPRIRILLDTTERSKRAFYLFAAAKGLTAPEAFEEIVRLHLVKYLQLADEEIASESPKPNKKPKTE